MTLNSESIYLPLNRRSYSGRNNVEPGCNFKCRDPRTKGRCDVMCKVCGEVYRWENIRRVGEGTPFAAVLAERDPCRCEREADAKRLQERASVPVARLRTVERCSDYRNLEGDQRKVTFRDLELSNPTIRTAADMCLKLVDWFPNRKGVIVFGSIAVNKLDIALAAMNKAATRERYPLFTKLYHEALLAEQTSHEYQLSKQSDYMPTKPILQQARESDLLVIRGLGKFSGYEWWCTKLLETLMWFKFNSSRHKLILLSDHPDEVELVKHWGRDYGPDLWECIKSICDPVYIRKA
jgi:DNA replication protein DnaC